MLGPVLSLALAGLLAMASAAHGSPADDLLDAPGPALATDSPKVLLDRAAHDPIWLALLHQARHSITGSAREAFDEADFFYHPEGATRPDLELVATRDAFLASDPERAQSARCRFPARFQLLIERGLLLDVPRGACPELDA